MKQKKRILMGVTGSIGAGKTTVARIFSKLGAKVIDVDKIVDVIYKTNKKIIKRIGRRFGKEVLTSKGALNKRILSSLAFADKKSTGALNRIVHPLVLKILKEKIKKSKGVLVIDAPLLIESGFYKNVDYVVLVKSILNLQIKRCKANNRLSEVECKSRFRQQLPFKYKKRFSDFIIENSSSLENLKKQVTEIFNWVK